MAKKITLLHFKFKENGRIIDSIGFSTVYESLNDASNLTLAVTCSNKDTIEAYENFCDEHEDYFIDSSEDFTNFIDVYNNGYGYLDFKTIYSNELKLNKDSILYGYLLPNVEYADDEVGNILYISTKKYQNAQELLQELYPEDEMISDDLIFTECSINDFDYYIPC